MASSYQPKVSDVIVGTSTTFRLVTELHDGGLLSRSPDKRFRIGPLLTALVTGRDRSASDQ